jgi:uncharacterized protein YjbI with pentapeptide repeats
MSPRAAAWILLVVGLGICVGGYVHLHGWNRGFISKDLYSNLGTTLLGAAIAVLVIDRLAERRASEAEVERLIRDVARSDRNLALRAVDELRALGHLSNGDLDDRNFSMADLRDGALGDIRARGARCFGTKFARSDLSGADLNGAELNRADLTRCNLEKAKLAGAELIETILEQADCAEADLAGAHLLSTDINGADLRRTNLEDARFEGVDFSRAKMSGARLGGATVDADSTLPPNAPTPTTLASGECRWDPGAIWGG